MASLPLNRYPIRNINFSTDIKCENANQYYCLLNQLDNHFKDHAIVANFGVDPRNIS